MLRLEFDGLFRNADENNTSAGIMCYGWRVLRGKREVAHGHGTFARGSCANSNIAEYLALLEGLDALLDMGATSERILVCGDAKSVINQMQGVAGVSSASIKPLYSQAIRLAHRFSNLRWQWLPRKQNRSADLLSRHALKHLWHNSAEYKTLLQRLQASARNGFSDRLMDIGGLRVYQPT